MNILYISETAIFNIPKTKNFPPNTTTTAQNTH